MVTGGRDSIYFSYVGIYIIYIITGIIESYSEIIMKPYYWIGIKKVMYNKIMDKRRLCSFVLMSSLVVPTTYLQQT